MRFDILIGALLLLTSAGVHGRSLDERVKIYSDRYALSSVNEKKVDNRGNGFEDLYGVRNFREVLKGVFYRGGANNYYHRTNRRDNRNPLMQDGIRNLCREGFQETVYLYTKNFSTAPRQFACERRAEVQAGSHMIEYKQISPLIGERYKDILKLIYDNINNPDGRPIYAHCWNGWHASGFISAVALKQFCDFTNVQAVSYWDANTDGNNTSPNYERIRVKIRNFQPDSAMSISSQAKALICPPRDTK